MIVHDKGVRKKIFHSDLGKKKEPLELKRKTKKYLKLIKYWSSSVRSPTSAECIKDKNILKATSRTKRNWNLRLRW